MTKTAIEQKRVLYIMTDIRGNIHGCFHDLEIAKRVRFLKKKETGKNIYITKIDEFDKPLTLEKTLDEINEMVWCRKLVFYVKTNGHVIFDRLENDLVTPEKINTVDVIHHSINNKNSTFSVYYYTTENCEDFDLEASEYKSLIERILLKLNNWKYQHIGELW